MPKKTRAKNQDVETGPDDVRYEYLIRDGVEMVVMMLPVTGSPGEYVRVLRAIDEYGMSQNQRAKLRELGQLMRDTELTLSQFV
jgi:hypothetical protein